jgi:hypothetical protein
VSLIAFKTSESGRGIVLLFIIVLSTLLCIFLFVSPLCFTFLFHSLFLIPSSDSSYSSAFFPVFSNFLFLRFLLLSSLPSPYSPSFPSSYRSSFFPIIPLPSDYRAIRCYHYRAREIRGK